MYKQKTSAIVRLYFPTLLYEHSTNHTFREIHYKCDDNSLSLSYKAIYQPHQSLDSIPDAGVPDAEESVILLFAVPIDEEMRH